MTSAAPRPRTRRPFYLLIVLAVSLGSLLLGPSSASAAPASGQLLYVTCSSATMRSAPGGSVLRTLYQNYRVRYLSGWSTPWTYVYRDVPSGRQYGYMLTSCLATSPVITEE